MLREALVRHVGRTAYAPTQGLPALRESIHAFYRDVYHTTFDADALYVFPGSKMGLFALGAVLAPTTYLIPTPSWVSYAPQARMMGHRVVELPTDDTLRVEPAVLDEALTAAATDGSTDGATAAATDGATDGATDAATTGAVLVLNSPGNPTGTVYDAARLQALCRVCRAHKTLLLFDSIYAHTRTFEGEPFAYASTFYPEGTVVTGGISKLFGAGGKRLGFVHVPRSLGLHRALVGFMSETVSAVDVSLQHACVELYSPAHRPAVLAYLDRTQRVHACFSACVAEDLRAMGLDVAEPTGAFYLFPSFERHREALERCGVRTSTDLARRLLDEHGVATLPATAFNACPTLSLRVCTQDFDGARALAAVEAGETVDRAFFVRYAPAAVAGLAALRAFLGDLTPTAGT